MFHTVSHASHKDILFVLFFLWNVLFPFAHCVVLNFTFPRWKPWEWVGSSIRLVLNVANEFENGRSLGTILLLLSATGSIIWQLDKNQEAHCVPTLGVH